MTPQVSDQFSLPRKACKVTLHTTIRFQPQGPFEADQVSLKARSLHRGNWRGAACARPRAAMEVVLCAHGMTDVDVMRRGEMESVIGGKDGAAPRQHKVGYHRNRNDKLSVSSTNWLEIADHHACSTNRLWSPVSPLVKRFQVRGVPPIYVLELQRQSSHSSAHAATFWLVNRW